MVVNEELNVLRKEEHIILRQFDRKEISEEEFIMKIKDVQKRIKEKLDVLLGGYKKQRLEENKMVDEQSAEAPKVEAKKKGKGLVEGSVAAAIAKALQLKTIKNIDSAAAKVVELKPEIELAKAKSRIKLSIRECKAGKGRWGNYVWNDETFQLTEKA